MVYYIGGGNGMAGMALATSLFGLVWPFLSLTIPDLMIETLHFQKQIKPPVDIEI